MTTLNTIATAIELALEHGLTKEQAINLLCQIRNQIRDQQQEEWERLQTSRARWSKLTPYDGDETPTGEG
jgi:hypothetical protein